MRWALLLATLSLVSCGPSNNEVEVADVNARDALDQVSSLRSRVDELESENAALKARLDYIEAEIS
jgi:uncharacterized protein YceH (UPF0502 family)